MNKLAQGEHRIERDYVGEVAIPGDKLYGVNTVRGVDNLTVSPLNIAHYPEFGDAFPVWSRSALHRPRDGRPSYLHGHERKCTLDRAGVSPVGWDSSGCGIGGGAGEGVVGGADRCEVGRSLPAPQGGRPFGSASPSDLAGGDRLEL